MSQLIEFKSNDVVLRGAFHLSTEKPIKDPLVVIATGDGKSGSKSNTYKAIIPKILACGISVFTFDFAGKGYSDGDDRKLTIQSGVDDLSAAMDRLSKEKWIDISRIGLLGSSYGGNVVLNYAAHNPNTVKTLALKSPACFYPEVYEIDLESIDNLLAWESSGYSDIAGRYFNSYLEAFDHNIYKLAKNIRVPVLITHGTADSNVPFIQSIRLKLCLQGEVKLVPLEGVTHDYKENNSLEIASRIYADWFRKML